MLWQWPRDMRSARGPVQGSGSLVKVDTVLDVVDSTIDSSLLTPLQNLLCALYPLLALWEIPACSTG